MPDCEGRRKKGLKKKKKPSGCRVHRFGVNRAQAVVEDLQVSHVGLEGFMV